MNSAAISMANLVRRPAPLSATAPTMIAIAARFCSPWEAGTGSCPGAKTPAPVNYRDVSFALGV